MADENNSNQICNNGVSANFMLTEYNYHAQEKLRKVQQGENRFNILIAIVTALLGGTGALATYSGKPGLEWIDQNRTIILFALLATLTFGYLTFLRTIHRDLDIDKERKALNKIRRYFIERDGYISNFLDPIDDKPHSKPVWKGILPYEGNLVQFVQLINSILAGIISVVLFRGWIGMGGLGFLFAWIAQFIWLKRRYDRVEKANTRCKAN